MLTPMKIETKHVALEKEAIPVWLLSPVVVARLFPNLAGFTSYGQVPVVSVVAQADILNGVPEVVAERRILKETPIFVTAEQLVTAVDLRTFVRVAGLCGQRSCDDEESESDQRTGFCYHSHLANTAIVEGLAWTV